MWPVTERRPLWPPCPPPLLIFTRPKGKSSSSCMTMTSSGATLKSRANHYSPLIHVGLGINSPTTSPPNRVLTNVPLNFSFGTSQSLEQIEHLKSALCRVPTYFMRDFRPSTVHGALPRPSQGVTSSEELLLRSFLCFSARFFLFQFPSAFRSDRNHSEVMLVSRSYISWKLEF